MKKTLLKAVVFLLTFLLSVVIINRIINRDYDSMTVEMSPASLPVISFEQLGEYCNALYGHTATLDYGLQRDSITMLNQDRSLAFQIRLYGTKVNTIQYEVRDIEEARLIENNAVTDLEFFGDAVTAKIALKDLYEQGKEYLLVLKLGMVNNIEVSYYTRLIWSEELHFQEKLQYVQDFHQRLYNKEAAKELVKYLEPNSSLADNSTLHKVNIHSSFKQITWGDLQPEEMEKPQYTLREISNQTMSVTLDYRVKHKNAEGEERIYLAQEFYRIRYTPDRMYLLEYERETNELTDANNMCANDKLLLGVRSEAVDMMESADGNTVVFVNNKRLFSYNTITNKLVIIFSFYEEGNFDERNLNPNHDIKILGVDEAGNVDYVVYGYMNRGIHEGETGLWVRRYESTTNTNVESVFVPSTRPYRVLKWEAEKLLYLSKLKDFYFLMEDQVSCVNLDDLTIEQIGEVTLEDSLYVSNDNSIIVWQEGETESCRSLVINNLSKDAKPLSINAGYNEVLKPLGFIGEDIIYGVARKEDLIRDMAGTLFVPMYKVIIANVQGAILKEYINEGIYVTDCQVEDNQITLTRVAKNSQGMYETILDDHIANNQKLQEGKNTIKAPTIDIYGKYVQIQVKASIDTKSLQVLQPKDVVFEGGRMLEISKPEREEQVYYVFGKDGVELITRLPGKAVSAASQMAGTVINNKGKVIWKKQIRSGRNQIMAIKEPIVTAKEDSFSVCLDAMLMQEGINRDTKNLLEAGEDIGSILEDNLEGSIALNLQGCSLDAVLYYVSQDIPVYATLGDEAVLVTGYNEFNVVIYQPSTGRLYKKGLYDSTEWFAKYGNQFFAYCR